ncbi:small RNA-binding protein 11, chloroplastic-like [Euphorbia lathyris]|uniref:small RNA-binding protein 11, chloroplastic-like n=1 Tax=Euphorbia lathyris TaxID=212925 RepID=UPI003313A8F3
MAKRLGTQLFVSRLSPYTTTQKLEKLFSPFGVVREARLVRDPITRKPKGFGFVTFDSEDEAQKAIKTMDGRIVDGGLIFVEVAKSTEPSDNAGS